MDTNNSIVLLLILSLFVLFTCDSLSQKNTEKFRDIKPDGFYHTTNLALNMNKGNEEYVKYLGDYRVDLYSNNFITYMIFNFEYKEGNNRLITNRGFAHYRFIYNKGEIIEPELFSQLEYNDFLHLNKRFLLGGGLRFSFWDLQTVDSLHRISFETGIGIMYEYENVTDPVLPITKYIRSSNFLSLRYNYNKTINVFLVAYYQPHIKLIADYRILTENRFSFSINKNFAVFMALNLRYDSDPNPQLKDYDLEIANGITLTF